MQILQEEMLDWYADYKPKIYQRSYDMFNSIRVDDFVEVNINKGKCAIHIIFDDSAFHTSLFDDGKVNVIPLMNYGYETHNKPFSDVPYFGYRYGGHFIEKAVSRFNNDNPYGIELVIEKGG